MIVIASFVSLILFPYQIYNSPAEPEEIRTQNLKSELEAKFKGLDSKLLEIDEDWDTFGDLYDHCTACVEKLTTESKLSQDQLLQFYGLFKQARDGDASNSPAPSILDLRANKKYSKWSEFKGLTSEESQRFYILLLCSLSKEQEEKALKVLLGEEEAEESMISAMNAISVPVVDEKAKQQYLQSMNENKQHIFKQFEDIRTNGEECLLSMIEQNELAPNTENNEGFTTFMLAVDESYSLEWLSKLIELGANVDHQDKNGNTALHYAAMVDNAEICQLLLEKGVDKNIKNNEDMMAQELTEEEEVKVLFENE